MDVLAFATKGPGSDDDARIAYLLAPLAPRMVEVDARGKPALARALLGEIRRRRPDVVVMEGTGAAGGAAVMGARLRDGVPYVVSSGDAVGPFLRAFHPRTAPVAGLYERSLYRLSAGFIGWSPYLVGRALALGAPRGMTAAHFNTRRLAPQARDAVRARLGIPAEAVVFGIVGRVLVDHRQGYSYGVELIKALRRTDRPDLRVLVVGDGDGLEALERLAGPELGGRVLLAGRCSPEEVGEYLAAMDVGALSQSTDLIGAMRFTTKLPEYLAAGLPVVAGQTPAAYDLDGGWLWRLPGDAPWDEEHIAALAALMQTVTREEIAERAALVPRELAAFDAEAQQRRVSDFVREIAARA
jgi:glycosyltransferase involved in cell wall biosynthesis